MPQRTRTPVPTAGAASLAEARPLVAQAATARSKNADIVCVWTSASAGGAPASAFAPKAPVYLLAAWHIPSRKDLTRLRLKVRWDIFRGYHPDVSLLPLAKSRVSTRQVAVSAAPKPGTFKLSSTPHIDGLKRGWYSLVARVQLAGGTCPSSACVGRMRHTRFFVH